MSLPSFALRRPVTTVMIYVGVALVGAIAWTRMPQELFPPITYPQVAVVTRYKDAAPEEIELLVSKPIEEVVGTVAGLRRVSSLSKEEISLVLAEFTWGTNMDFAALGVREKLDLVKERLPRGAEDPVVIKYNPFELPVLVLNVSGPLSPYALRELARRRLKDGLEKVEGVASVTITGGLEREILVEVDQGRLEASGTSIVALTEALSKANLNYPAGTIKEAFYEYLIRTIGEFQVVPEIPKIAVNIEEDERLRRPRAEPPSTPSRPREQPLRREPGIAPSPRLVLLRDVAVVKDTYKERTSISRYNGQENVSLSIQKQSGENTVRVVTRILRALDQLTPSLPPGVAIHVASDQSRSIRQAVRGVVDAGWLGALFAFGVLWLFLRSVVVSLNVTAAIPLSILVTLGFMYFSGVSINVISMGGLALGVGMLVDAGIVVVENIERHRELGKPLQHAAVEGTHEVVGAIVGSILTNIVPFLPLVFVYGLVGQLFKDLAFTVTFSNVASLVVSMTLTPLVASWARPVRHPVSQGAMSHGARRESWLRQMDAAPRSSDQWLRRQELALVRWFLDHPWLGMVIVVGSFLVGLAVLQTLPREFLPKVDQGQFAVKVEMPPGTRLEVTDRVAQYLQRRVMAHPAVQDVTVNIGSTKGETGAELIETRGPHQGQILVGLRPRAQRLPPAEAAPRPSGQRRLSTDQVIQQVRAALDRASLEGAQLDFVAEESAMKATALASAPVVIEVRGDRLNTLEALANTVARELAAVPGLYSVHTSLVPPSPEMKVHVLKDRAATYHLSVSDIAVTAQTAVKGFVATKFKEAGREIDVRVRLRPQDRRDFARVRRLAIRSPLNLTLPLAEVAYLALGTGPTEIRRQDRQRIIHVSGNVSQRPFGEAMRDVTAVLQGVSVPAGYEVKVAGEQEEMQASFQSLVFAAGLAFLLVYMVMAATFESLWQPFLIMATIPMSLSGVAVALLITKTPVSAMVGLGVMLLGGIVVNNGIVLIDFVNQLRREQGLPVYEALLQASQTRLRPILMTAATAVLGLLPLALGVAEGSELQGPMGITIMGGLISATFLTLVFLPTLFLISDRFLRFLARVLLRRAPAATPAPAVAEGEPALAGAPEPVVARRWEMTEAPEIPEDYGREDAVPTEPLTAATLILPMLPPEIFGGEPSSPAPSAPPRLAPPPVSLNARQRWLLETLKTVGRLSRKQYAVQQGISIPTAARDLKDLVDAGLLRGVGPLGPGRQYELC